jgi:hypothetical protein
LAPGQYRVDVVLAGFRTLRREGVQLETGEQARLDVAAAVGGVNEQVTVTAGDPRVVQLALKFLF